MDERKPWSELGVARDALSDFHSFDERSAQPTLNEPETAVRGDQPGGKRRYGGPRKD
jgi:hypothetical protein